MGYKYSKNFVFLGRQKPTRKQLDGMSPSEFKTFLKLKGFKVCRKFFKRGSIAQYRSRLYRFNWWNERFFVDISCLKQDFCRWANSTDIRISFKELIDEVKKDL